MQEWQSNPGMVIERAAGRYLIDTEGNRYYDAVSSIWVNIHGHNNATLNRALHSQLKKVAHSTLLGLSNIPSIHLAKELVRLSPVGLKKVFYSDNGSSAMEIAIKMAYQFWQQQGKEFHQKKKFVALDMGYHGDSLGNMSVSGISLFHNAYKSLLFKTFKVDPPYCYRCPFQLNFPSCRLACIQPIETLIRENHKKIAAFIIEPMVQGVGGIIVSPPGYLSALRELCTRYDVLLIADEVATGFGRTGKMFACDHEDVTPDLMALSKGLTGGYMPLAATLTTQRVYDAFLGRYEDLKTFFHGHSYTGNPLGCAVAVANLKLLKRKDFFAVLPKKVNALRDELKKIKSLPHVGDVRQLGLMVGIELVQGKRTKEPYDFKTRIGQLVATEARERGLLMRPIGNIIILMPPVTATIGELKMVVEVTRLAIKAVTQK